MKRIIIFAILIGFSLASFSQVLDNHTGTGWRQNYVKNDFRDSTYFGKPTYFYSTTRIAGLWYIGATSITATGAEINKLASLTGNIITSSDTAARFAYYARLLTPTFITNITSPLVYGSSAANGDLTLEGTSSGTKTSSYVILQPTTGNVGIGTTSPNSNVKLTVAGGGIDVGEVDNANMFRINYDMTDGGSLQSYIGGGVAKMSLNPSGGNIGIGLTSPTGRLHVYGAKTTDDLLYVSNDANATKDSTVVVTKLGRVGIGITTPQSPLQINSAIGEVIRMSYNADENYYHKITNNYNAVTAASNTIKFSLNTAVSSTTVDVLTLFGSGKVGIASTTAPELLTLGTAGTTEGVLSLAGATSGKAIINVSAAAGTPTLTLPTSTGTFELKGDTARTPGNHVTDAMLDVVEADLRTFEQVPSWVVTFGVGGSNPGDTLAITDSTILGSFYNGTGKTMHVDSVNVITGKGEGIDTIGIQIQWHTVFKAASATKLWTNTLGVGRTAGSPAVPTCNTTGILSVSFTNPTIPAGKRIWCTIPYHPADGLKRKPKYVEVSMFGHYN